MQHVVQFLNFCSSFFQLRSSLFLASHMPCTMACGYQEQRYWKPRLEAANYTSQLLIFVFNIFDEEDWLPVRHRINFKIAAITHTVLQSQQPSYLAALVPRYAPVRSLRSSSSLSICVPLRKTSMAASRSFSSVAPKILNALPGHLSSIPTSCFQKSSQTPFFLLCLSWQ